MLIQKENVMSMVLEQFTSERFGSNVEFAQIPHTPTQLAGSRSSRVMNQPLCHQWRCWDQWCATKDFKLRPSSSASSSSSSSISSSWFSNPADSKPVACFAHPLLPSLTQLL